MVRPSSGLPESRMINGNPRRRTTRSPKSNVRLVGEIPFGSGRCTDQVGGGSGVKLVENTRSSPPGGPEKGAPFGGHSKIAFPERVRPSLFHGLPDAAGDGVRCILGNLCFSASRFRTEGIPNHWPIAGDLSKPVRIERLVVSFSRRSWQVLPQRGWWVSERLLQTLKSQRLTMPGR